MSYTTPPSCLLRIALGLVAALLGAADADAKTISGVCPDGSIFKP